MSPLTVVYPDGSFRQFTEGDLLLLIAAKQGRQ